MSDARPTIQYTITDAKSLSDDEILRRLDKVGFDIRSRAGINYAWKGRDCTFSQDGPRLGSLWGRCASCNWTKNRDGTCSRPSCRDSE